MFILLSFFNNVGIGFTMIKQSKKAQSAMEYLMTYGWAILVIAVVLSALFGLGLFNSNSFANNACIATPGFLCTNPVYSHSNANIIVTLGQNTGTSWTSANFVFVPQGTPYDSTGIPAISFNSSPANTSFSVRGMASGSTAQVYLPVNSIPIPVIVGTPIMGTIWAQYSYLSSSQGITQVQGPAYVQLAAINMKAS
jgi:hypothetical protein